MVPNPARPYAASVLLVLLVGCAAVRPAPAPPPPAEQAAGYAARGEYSQAAALYEQAARGAQEPLRSRYYLRAGTAAARAGNGELARQLLARVDPAQFDDQSRSELALAQMRARAAGLPPAQALDQVPPPTSAATPALAAGIWGLRAELLFAAQQPVQGVHALVQRGYWLSDPAKIQANDQRIWNQLRSLHNPGRNQAALTAADAITRGWVELAQIGAGVAADRATLESRLAAWEQRHPGHPATRSVLPQRFGYTPTQRIGPGFDGRGPQVVGLALPLSGEFASAAAAVRDGFLAGYFQQSPPRIDLRVYDTSALTESARLLATARDDGVGLLVGPLDKDRVAALGAGRDPRLPLLALNYADTGGRFAGFFQFGLAPEDEARAVAMRALAEGWYRALALVPDGEWGSRVLTAFRDALHAGGGQLIDYATYDASEPDHAQPIKRLLQYRGVSGAAEPVPAGAPPVERGRRHDVDFIFVAAQPDQARLIRTQLRFFRATRLPVLATSHVYGGHPNPANDIDLNGLMFADMPWILSNAPDVARLRQRLSARWQQSAEAFPRLFAMGLDAWRLAARIRSGGLSPGKLFTGATGDLYLEPDGQIRRRLDWARFVQGVPQPLPELRRIEIEPSRRYNIANPELRSRPGSPGVEPRR